MLFRLSEEDYIAEDYGRSEPDISHLLLGILDLIFCSEDQIFTSSSYEIVMKWLKMMVDRVVIGECKHSGSMMGLFRVLLS